MMASSPQDATTEVMYIPPARANLSYASPLALGSSILTRFKSLWTRQFILALVFGQAASLCISFTDGISAELVTRRWLSSTTQTFPLYFSLFLIYTPFTVYRYGMDGWAKLVLRDGWKYFILAVCDVEGNFLAVKAYHSTALFLCMILNTWAIPMCLLFSWLYMRPRYHWSQFLAILITLAGLGMLTISSPTNQSSTANFPKGDLLVIIAASLYGFTSATEELFVRNSPLYEVLGQLGMYGMIINGVQAAILERNLWTVEHWDGTIIGPLIAYTIVMFILYTLAPWIYRFASSVYFNINLLTSQFYSLLVGILLYHYPPYWLMFPGFLVSLTGLVVYFWNVTPEEQGNFEPKAPEYVQQRGLPALNLKPKSERVGQRGVREMMGERQTKRQVFASC